MVMALFISIGWTLSFMMLFSPHIENMQGFMTTLILLSTGNLFTVPEFVDYVVQPKHQYLGILGMLHSQTQIMFMVILLVI